MIGIKNIFLLSLLTLTSCKEKEATSLDIPSETSDIEIEEVRISPYRCSYEDCLCSVRIPRYTPVYEEGTARSWTSVFFYEDESVLSEDYAKNVIEFMNSRMHANTVLSIGHTDGCGLYGYNLILSRQRASVVSKLIRTIGFRNRIITVGNCWNWLNMFDGNDFILFNTTGSLNFGDITLFFTDKRPCDRRSY